MITSFYFVMWIAIYFLIFLSGNPTLIDYGFYAAFIGVFLLGRAADSLCRDAIERRNERDVTAMLEILYTGDKRKLVSVFHKKFLLAAASFIYMAIATIGLLFAHASLIIVGIFALNFHRHVGESFHQLRQGLGHVQIDEVAESEFLFFRIIGGAAVVQQQRSVDGDNVHVLPVHGHTAAGIDGEGAAICHKEGNSIQIPLGDLGIGAGHRPVKIPSQ